ncbi:hypothetical protein L2E82_10467 [Cichorium intybus]|uniref:Uncharacterized protein n=1 Tax=Cichorium intybus TaxID=13427 RepID=A0ACB9GBA0_CICIN|nr:hypothetical protein L2E82_10467 [Cichorium intybus]
MHLSSLLLTSFLEDSSTNVTTSCIPPGENSSFHEPSIIHHKPCPACDASNGSVVHNEAPHTVLPNSAPTDPVSDGVQPSAPDGSDPSPHQDNMPFPNSDQPHSATTSGSLHSPTSTNMHPMTTRAKAGIFKPKHQANLASLKFHPLHIALFSEHAPKGFKSASKNPKWLQAMHEEMTALRQNDTWILVPRPPNTNVVGSKWVFRTKYNSDGTIDRYKARLVAQGFTQLPGVDYSHTFSPVVKASTVRIVLSLAVINQWRLHQLDVKNAFLHGHLTETVYMEQPPGFSDSHFPQHVCRLKKALYGLKQAPRACISSFICRLHKEFAIKDLGDLNYFLGLEVSYTTDGLFLCQSKYANDILDRAGLRESKPVHTPLAPHDSFTSIGDPFSDTTLYRSLVGALQYLTITRPDISYAVNQVSQFLQAPTVSHYQCVKRILRYVKGTLGFGLTFTRPHQTSILGYSDADWARCIETRRSTYGYSIFLGGNLVSWSAKKQPTVSRSSCESEYRAMANTAAEIVWITHLLRELHALPPDRPTLLCDNRSALFLTQNPVAHKRSKHIDLDYHFIRELVSSGKLYTKFVPTKLQVADIFTKSLPRTQFDFFRAMLRLGPPPFRLRGDIRNK